MKIVILALLMVAIVSARYTQMEANQIFQAWKITQQKVYDDEEMETYRFAIFQHNLELIDQLNAE